MKEHNYALQNSDTCCSSNFFFGLNFFKLVYIFHTVVKFSYWFKIFNHTTHSRLFVYLAMLPSRRANTF